MLVSFVRRGLSQPLYWRAGQGRGMDVLISIGRRGLTQPLCLRAQQVRALLGHVFHWSAWALPATVVAGMAGEGAALASVRLVVLGSNCHSGGGHDR